MTLIVTTVFGVLSLAAVVGTVGLAASPVLRQAVRRDATGVVAAVSGTMTTGSLYLSEVAGYVPCELCWVQRVFAYSIAVISLMALLGRRPDALWHVRPLAVLGLATSLWHVVVQRIPAAGGICEPTNPCSAIYVERFGLLTIPTMAATGFALILALALAAHGTSTDRPSPTPKLQETDR